VVELSARADSFDVLHAYAATRFRTEGFVYSLRPGRLESTTQAARLEEFMLRQRKGFCEHYAGALATLFRFAGIPARVVVGFQGGLRNASLSVVTVRDAEAHAWVEAFDSRAGRWKRFDATGWIAQGRLTGSEGDATAATLGTRWTSDVTLTIARWTEPLRTLWAFAVAGVRERASLKLFREIFASVWQESAFGILGALAGLTGLGYALLVSLRTSRAWRGRDAEGLLFERFRKVVRKEGVEPLPWQGPLALAQSVALAFPTCGEEATCVASALSALLYAGPLETAKGTRAKTKEVERAIGKLGVSLRQARKAVRAAKKIRGRASALR